MGSEAADKLSELFTTLAGHDAEIDAWELQKILTIALKKGKPVRGRSHGANGGQGVVILRITGVYPP